MANDPVNWGSMSAHGPQGPAKWRPTCIDDWCTINLDIREFRQNPLGGDYQEYVGNQYQSMESISFYFRKSDVLADTTETPVNVGWLRVS